MMITQKCQYALRAIFELSRRAGKGPVKISDIAAAQSIPPQFLETILNQLKQAGYVESRRGVRGGYVLTVSPKQLSAGDIIRRIDGLGKPVKCVVGGGLDCPMRGNCAFNEMWEKAGAALSKIFDSTTFHDLLEKQRSLTKTAARQRGGAQAHPTRPGAPAT
ncbi:MAG: Rrf2 family transcriptional regulator [Planctomycetes bacterium]|nr:Rrf2 family transcriptional regulator [Planctomycetota bacterium]